MLNLDTHILLHALTGDLSPKERKILSQHTWSISSIVLWEITKLYQLKRIQLSLHHPELQTVLKQLEILPINFLVCKAMDTLDFKSDPADELIAATSIAYKIPLITRDTKILKSKKVPLIEI